MQSFWDITLLLAIIGSSMLTGAYFAARGFEKSMLSLMEEMKNDDYSQMPSTEKRGHDAKDG